jgi:cbb3-type cytochrome oxidase maturation protein
MTGLAVLIPLALMLGLSGLAAFFWALKAGQFEDLDGAALRILIDDEAFPSNSVTRGGAECTVPPSRPEIPGKADPQITPSR